MQSAFSSEVILRTCRRFGVYGYLLDTAANFIDNTYVFGASLASCADDLQSGAKPDFLFFSRKYLQQFLPGFLEKNGAIDCLP